MISQLADAFLASLVASGYFESKEPTPEQQDSPSPSVVVSTGP